MEKTEGQLSYLPDKVTILSHPNPDVDSIISGYLIKKLLEYYNKDADFIIPDEKITTESYKMCLKYGIDAEKYMGKLPADANLFLVDHHITEEVGNVVGIVDHHPTEREIDLPLYINPKSCSTALNIYKLNPSVFDKRDIMLVALASIVDTVCFKSTKASPTDEEYIKFLCEKNNLNYAELYMEGLGLTDLEDFDKAVINGLKEHNFGKYRIKSSYIQIDKINEKVLELFIDGCQELLMKEDLFMWIFLVHNMSLFRTTAYLIRKDKVRAVEYDAIASRGNTVIPSIERRLLGK